MTGVAQGIGENDINSLHAIYYPHSVIRDLEFLKIALLLWDDVRTIVPWTGFSGHAEGVAAEAAELVVRGYEPSSEEKARVHGRIAGLVEEAVPEWVIVEPTGQNYEIYAEKLLPKTWDLLVKRRLAVRGQERDGFVDFVLRPGAGLTVMAALAEACGGTQYRAITDRLDAFAAWGRYVTWVEGGEYETIDEAPTVPVAVAEHFLVSRGMTTWRVGQIPIRRLIDLRRRDDREMGRLRRKFAGVTRVYAERMRTQVRTSADVVAIESDYRKDLKRDLHDLATELGAVGMDDLLGEGGLIEAGVELATNVGVGAILKGVVGVGRRLLRKGARTKSVLESHWSSFLKVASQPRR